MKKIIITVFILFSLCSLQGCTNNFGCSSLRNYHTGPDKKINELKEKITDLEKETIKDVKTSSQLGAAYNQLGLIYLDKKLWDSAIDSFQNCIKNGNNGAGIYYALGLAYANRGKESSSEPDLTKAAQCYRRAIELQENLYDAKYALSILQFYHLDDKVEAIRSLERLVSENRKHYRGRFALGKFYYETGKLDQSLNVYEDLYDDVEKLPDSQTSMEYRNSAKENINIIMMQISHRKEVK